MRRAAEALAFLALASAVHAGAWIGLGGGPGLPASGAGSGGTAPLELAAADAATAALVRRWDAPPAATVTQPTPASPRSGAMAPGPPSVPAADAGAPLARIAPTAPPLPPAGEAAPGTSVAETAPLPDMPRPRPRREAFADGNAAPPAEPAPQAAARVEQPRQGQAARRAEGAGARQAAGEHGAGSARSASAGDLRALEREWGAAILSRIARRQAYPPGDHGSGTARVTLTVGRDGRLRGVSLAASSGSSALDRAALDAVRRAGRFPPAPAGLDRAAYTFAVPMTFRRD